MKDGEPIITIRGLDNSFGEQVIHKDLDLDVRRGEILGVVGGSGTGKSVLMRSIIGLQTPAEGEIEVLGENMIGRSEDEAKNIRRRWGILFQNGALFSTLTVAENVEVPIREYFPFIKQPLLDEIAVVQDRDERPSGRRRAQISIGAVGRDAQARRSCPGAGARSRTACSSTSRPPGSTRSVPRRSTN